MAFAASDIAVVVPTRNRPEKVDLFLQSIAAQRHLPGRILIVASGDPIDATVAHWKDRLPVECLHSDVGGQIHQRNLGLDRLDDRTPLVACFDDDIVLEPDALDAMLRFLNERQPVPIGVAFNITNEPPAAFDARRAGSVLPDGRNPMLFPADRSFRTQWLPGGATLWRQMILREHHHPPIRTRWAICEDLIFSYPLGKQHELWVCAEARVQHHHVGPPPGFARGWRTGKFTSLWRAYFVASNADLSMSRFLCTLLAKCVARSIGGALRGSRQTLGEGLGIAAGLCALAAHAARRRSWTQTLESHG